MSEKLMPSALRSSKHARAFLFLLGGAGIIALAVGLGVGLSGGSSSSSPSSTPGNPGGTNPACLATLSCTTIYEQIEVCGTGPYAVVTLTPNLVYSFEAYQSLNSNNFTYAPALVQNDQPFTFYNNGSIANGGIANTYSPFRPANGQTLSTGGAQFAFIQPAHAVPGNGSALVFGLVPSQRYRLDFYWDTRSYTVCYTTNATGGASNYGYSCDDATTSIVLTATLNTTGVIYNSTSPVADESGVWQHAVGTTFTATSCTALLVMTGTPNATGPGYDQSVLFDQLQIVSVTS